MITKEEGKKIKKLFGYRYADKILKIFKEQKFFQENGEEYGSAAVRNWANNIQVSERLDNYCLEAVAIYKAEKDQREKRKREILSNV